tara:strand:+ start:116 stop:658 length:543 start_codon:yes stop_codon:yes gene_type:complete
MANSLLTYVKENPLEAALTVASIHPAVRGISLLHKGYKRAAKLRQILANRKSITLYRGVPLGKVPLKDAKDTLRYNKNFGGWFTTDKGQARWYARKNLPTDLRYGGGAGKQFVGKLYSVKVSPLELRKIKQGSAFYNATYRKFRGSHKRHEFSQKLDDKTFFGTVPKYIRKKATLLEGVK